MRNDKGLSKSGSSKEGDKNEMNMLEWMVCVWGANVLLSNTALVLWPSRESETQQPSG